MHAQKLNKSSRRKKAGFSKKIIRAYPLNSKRNWRESELTAVSLTEFRFSSQQLKLKVKMHRFAFSLPYKSRSHVWSRNPIRCSLICQMRQLITITTTKCIILIRNRRMPSASECRRSHHTCFNHNSPNLIKRCTQTYWTNSRPSKTATAGIKAISLPRFHPLRPSSTKLRYSCKGAGRARVQEPPQRSTIQAIRTRRCR